MLQKITIIIGLCINLLLYAQEEEFMLNSREDLIEAGSNYIINKSSLNEFYNKITKDSTATILHIGDSHVQANVFPGRLRELFQNKYGSSGRGIVFPLRLTGTNGHSDIRFYSNIKWDHEKLINIKKTKQVGLAGATISTNKPKFFIQLKNNDKIDIKSIKIIGKGLDKLKFGFLKKNIHLSKSKPIYTGSTSYYKVKKGDYLGKIAKKHKVSIRNLKRWNNLRNDRIAINQKLRIKKGRKTRYTPVKINMNNFELIKPSLISDDEIIVDTTEDFESLYIIRNEKKKSFTKIDAILLDNHNKGVTYHSIGINGAKYSDYNKSDLFFKQLETFNPDLIILSLGTNESFYNTQNAKRFRADVLKFLDNICEKYSCKNILLTTPPSSLVKRRRLNKKLEVLTNVLIEIATERNFALWNLYELTGEDKGAKKWFSKGLMSKDKIHYSTTGYEIQAEHLFDILKPEDSIEEDTTPETPVINDK